MKHEYIFLEFQRKKVRTPNKSFTVHVLLRGCLAEFDHEAQMETITSWQWDTFIDIDYTVYAYISTQKKFLYIIWFFQNYWKCD